MEFIFLILLIGLIPAMIARSKGKSFMLWWIYGALLFIIALVHSILMKSNNANLEKRQLAEGMKKCPKCAELVKQEATLCRFCNSEFS
tara:strand:- start:544 stop:807 length:264 start_codon:yes stop_codon:yes gene_type:complete